MTIEQKVAALLRKTTKNGCTPDEQVAATELARKLVAKHRLKETDFTWSAPPPKAGPTKAAKRPRRAPKSPKPGKAPRPAAKPSTKPAKRPTRGDEVMELLQRKGGCTMDELVKRTGLLQHTLRAVISVESRKRLLEVELVGRGHYRIV